jgi:hypothetical protein
MLVNAGQKRNLERRYRRNLSVADTIFTPTPESADPRSLQRKELITVVEQVNTLCDVERSKLYEVLVKYLSHMTTKPGKCNLFSYKFQVNHDKPIIGYSRPIPFATRSAVREQIDQMLRDDILETSASPILNPLTIVSKEGGKIRICVDASKVNQLTVPDHERSQPLHELLQRFNVARLN